MLYKTTAVFPAGPEVRWHVERQHAVSAVWEQESEDHPAPRTRSLCSRLLEGQAVEGCPRQGALAELGRQAGRLWQQVGRVCSSASPGLTELTNSSVTCHIHSTTQALSAHFWALPGWALAHDLCLH